MIYTIVSHYRLRRRLGAGRFGDVFLADDLWVRRQVAVKISSASFDDSINRTRFQREAQISATLGHPNIAAVHDYGETKDGKQFIVMEFIEGRSLRDVLDDGALSPEVSLKIVTEVAKALREAHRRGIIHRDIKPGNVVLTSRPGVKVLDFGLAKQLAFRLPASVATPREELLLPLTRPGMILGTPRYMSPEQALGLLADPRSDLFSLGAVFYECLTGVPAFSGATAREVCLQVIRTDPLPPSRINPRLPMKLDRVVMKTLAKDPALRYQSAAELLAALRSIGTLEVESDPYRTQEPFPALVPILVAPENPRRRGWMVRMLTRLLRFFSG